MFEVCVSTRFCLNVGVGKVKEQKKETQRESSEFILLSVCVLILFFSCIPFTACFSLEGH